MSVQVVFNKQNDYINLASHDRLFLGEGLFETIRVSNGKACYAHLHWQRLHDAANFIDIAFDLSLADWLNHLNACIEAIKLKHGGIKAILSGGHAPRGLMAKGSDPYLILEAFVYEPSFTPVRLISSPWKRDSNNPIYKIKSINYLEAIMAYRYAQANGADDALFFNMQNCVLETTIANFFLIIDDQLITPPLDFGILAGITRKRILALCQHYKKPYLEQAVSYSMFDKAHALFTCNVLQGIRPVVALDNISFKESHPLMTELAQMLREDKE